MPTLPDDKQSFSRLRLDGGSTPVLVQPIPPVPEEVKKRFPSMVKWEADLEAWRTKANRALGGGGP